ncbi:MAG: hypothetical protein N3B01_08375 [Verrucomicrobiae bacterium]|nr:hypothetical protein [Verrucomicrobiae bacterium]
MAERIARKAVMMQTAQRPSRTGLDLVDEAVHRLRQSPQPLALHLVGTAPFAVGLLYFWADMSSGAFAAQRCAGEAFLLALLYLWMKTWHCIFAGRMYAELAGESPPRWTCRRLLRVLAVQAVFQPSSFLLLPVAAVLTAPFMWIYAFYQNLTVIAHADAEPLAASARKAWQLARLWPGQNHVAMAATWLFGVFVFLNVLTALWLAPYLVKMLLGVETSFTTTSSWMFSSTTLAAAATLSWLIVSALTRTIYVLRCFYGESVRSGKDLMVELRSYGVAALLFAFSVSPMAASEPPAMTLPARPISAAELDRQIERTLQHNRYMWRFPRERSSGIEQRTLWAQLVRDFTATVKGWLRATLHQWRQINRWLRERFGWELHEQKRPGTDNDWPQSVRALLFASITATAAALTVLVWRFMRQRRVTPRTRSTPEPGRSAVDAAEDNATLEQRTEDEWLDLARRLSAEGQLRLALRALYLATLAHLARRKLICMASHKSNLEYERELARCARGHSELLAAFRLNRAVFEASWYGQHPVSEKVLGDFQLRLERIQADVAD